MNAILLLTATAVVGVDFGWQPTADGGGLEYIIQIEPEWLQALASGDVSELTSTIHPDVQNVRRFRIRIGTEKPPRIGAEMFRDQQKAANTDTQETAESTGTPQPKEAESAPPWTPPPRKSGSRWTTPPPEPSPTPAGEPNSSSQTAAPDEPQRDRTTQAPPTTADDGRPTLADVEHPGSFVPDPESEPLAHMPTAFTQSRDTGAEPVESPTNSAADVSSTILNARSDQNDHETDQTDAASPGTDKSGKPWGLLTFALLCLFASLGGNVYLGWIAWDTHGRYRTLARGVRGGKLEQ